MSADEDSILGISSRATRTWNTGFCWSRELFEAAEWVLLIKRVVWSSQIRSPLSSPGLSRIQHVLKCEYGIMACRNLISRVKGQKKPIEVIYCVPRLYPLFIYGPWSISHSISCALQIHSLHALIFTTDPTLPRWLHYVGCNGHRQDHGWLGNALLEVKIQNCCAVVRRVQVFIERHLKGEQRNCTQLPVHWLNGNQTVLVHLWAHRTHLDCQPFPAWPSLSVAATSNLINVCSYFRLDMKWNIQVRGSGMSLSDIGPSRKGSGQAQKRPSTNNNLPWPQEWKLCAALLYYWSVYALCVFNALCGRRIWSFIMVFKPAFMKQRRKYYIFNKLE